MFRAKLIMVRVKGVVIILGGGGDCVASNCTLGEAKTFILKLAGVVLGSLKFNSLTRFCKKPTG